MEVSSRTAGAHDSVGEMWFNFLFRHLGACASAVYIYRESGLTRSRDLKNGTGRRQAESAGNTERDTQSIPELRNTRSSADSWQKTRTVLPPRGFVELMILEVYRPVNRDGGNRERDRF